jgi:Rrf2 family iron-sulfur cluster assembly transcriptional regulator
MRLTSKGRYAVTAMLDIALHQHQGVVSLSDISMRQGISLSYLEQIFTRLRRDALVSSVRGPGGGYFIAEPLDQVTIKQIITSVNEELDARQCRGQGNCHQGQECLSHQLWHDLSSMIEDFLAQVSLQTLINRYQQTLAQADRSVISEVLLSEIRAHITH